MKRKRAIIIAGVASVAIGVVAVVICLSGPREPEYEGRKLSEWVHIYNRDVHRREDAAYAIRKIGTNALPYLVEWVGYDSPKWKIAPAKWLEGGPQWRKRLGRTLLYPEEVRRSEATGAFLALKEEGGVCVPALTHRLEVARSPYTKFGIESVLEMVSREGVDISAAVPVLLRTGWSTKWMLIDRFTGNSSVVPGLTNSLRHRDVVIRRRAVQELCMLCDRQGAYINLIRPALSDPDPEVRTQAAAFVLVRDAMENVGKR